MGSNGFMTTITPLHHIHVALERNPYDVVIGDGGLARLGQQMLDAEDNVGDKRLCLPPKLDLVLALGQKISLRLFTVP